MKSGTMQKIALVLIDEIEMNASMPSKQNDDIEFELAKMSEHAHSKRFRDRNNSSASKKNADRKDRKKSRGFASDESDEYYDEWD